MRLIRAGYGSGPLADGSYRLDAGEKRGKIAAKTWTITILL